MIPPYPLQWPEGLPRTSSRQSSKFKATLSQALKNVKDSLRLFGSDTGKIVSDVSLTSNVGGIDPGRPKDSGVAAWFTWNGQQRCIAVDRYGEVQENLQAIHHIIEARRTEMRHGGLHIVEQTFKGFTALPSNNRPWRDVLGFNPGSNPTAANVEAEYRQLAKRAHPDSGGTHELMAELNRAREQALKEIGA